MAICLEVIGSASSWSRSWRNSRSKRKLGANGERQQNPARLSGYLKETGIGKQGEESVIWCCVPRWSGVIKSLLVHRAWVGDLGYVWVGQCGGGWGWVQEGWLMCFWATAQHSTVAMWGRRSSQHLLPPRAFWLCPPVSPPATRILNLPHMNQFHHISIPPGVLVNFLKYIPNMFILFFCLI